MKERVDDMEVYLYTVSGSIKTNNLKLDIIEQCKKHIEESIENSTKYNFVESQFYQDLPPSIQKRLVHVVLHHDI